MNPLTVDTTGLNLDPNAQNSNPQPQAQGSKPNFFERLLPTAGGIIGGIGGSLLGGIGGIGGAAAGGALGQKLENMMTGGNQSTKSAGIENAFGMGVGGVLGKGLGTVTGKYIAPLAKKEAGNLLQGQAIKGSLDNPTAQLLRHGMGVSNLSQVADIAPLSTGADGALASGVKRGLTEADVPADFSKLTQVAQDLVAKNKMQLNDASVKGIDSTIKSALLQSVGPDDVTQMALKGARGQVSTAFTPGALKNVLPENAFKIAQNFEGLAQSAYNSAYDKMGNVVNPDQLAKYRIFNGLAQSAKKAAFGGDTPIPLTEANKAQIISELAPMKNINPTAHNYHVDQVTNAKNLQDLRPIQAPLVKASQALNATQNIVNNSGGRSLSDTVKTVAPVAGGMTAGPLGLAVGSIPMILGTNAADKVGSSVLGKLATGAQGKIATKILPVATRAATVAAANLPNEVSPQGQTNVQSTPGANMNQPEQNLLSQLYQQLLAQEQAAPTVLGPSLVPALNSLAPTVQKQQLAVPGIENALSTFANAGGAQGAGGGFLSRLTGLIPGTPANTYNAQSLAAATQLASVLGISVQAAQAMLPQLMQSQGTAAPQIGGVQSILGTLGANSSAIPAQ